MIYFKAFFLNFEQVDIQIHPHDLKDIWRKCLDRLNKEEKKDTYLYLSLKKFTKTGGIILFLSLPPKSESPNLADKWIV